MTTELELYYHNQARQSADSIALTRVWYIQTFVLLSMLFLGAALIVYSVLQVSGKEDYEKGNWTYIEAILLVVGILTSLTALALLVFHKQLLRSVWNGLLKEI
jgi:hypothetical protein